MDDNLRAVASAVRDLRGDSDLTDGEQLNDLLGRKSGDRATSSAIEILMRVYGYVEGNRDADGEWLEASLTPEGRKLLG